MASSRELLERYLDELDTWNRRLNLTTVPRAAAWQRHVDETVLLLASADLPAGARVLDIGSGGGVPGVIAAVLRPDLHLALVEADRRKSGFLVHVSGLLELDNVTVLTCRAEDLGREEAHRAGYDGALSRAAAPPARLCALALPLLRPGASLWALVSDAPAAAAATQAEAERAGAMAAAVAPGVLRVVTRAR